MGQAGNAASSQTTNAQPVRIGSNLWLVMISANGIDGGDFGAGQPYEYHPTSAGWGEVVSWAPFRYAGQFPCFEGIPNTHAGLRMAHASCRKPHGEDRDALAIVRDATASSRLAILFLAVFFLIGAAILAPVHPSETRP